MGIFVDLYALPDRIDPDAWEEAWPLTLELLRRFPGPLATVVRGDGDRFVFTPEIVFDAGSDEERWAIDGDLSSGLRAERFVLHRRWSTVPGDRRKGRPEGPGDDADILRAAFEDRERSTRRCDEIFGAKTQGYPYHYAALAAGVLLENLFPGAVFVTGDIDGRQSDLVCAWAGSTLGLQLLPPVVTDPPRLWNRLSVEFPEAGKRLFESFSYLSRSAEHEGWRSLAALDAGPPVEEIHEFLLSSIRSYRSLRQVGARGLLATWCRMDGRIGPLVDALCRPPEGPRARAFPLEEVLEVLCEGLITIPLEDRPIPGPLELPDDRLPSVDDLVLASVKVMTGAPTPIELHVEETELLREFASRWPAEEERFEEIIRSKTEEARWRLDAIRDQESGFPGPRPEPGSSWEPERTDLEAESDGPRSAGRQSARHGGERNHDPAAFIREEIRRQKPHIPGRREMARTIAAGSRKLLAREKDLAERIGALGREHLVRALSALSAERCFVLAASTWRAIDEEASAEELRALLLLAWHDLTQRDWVEARDQLLASRDLWPILAEGVMQK